LRRIEISAPTQNEPSRPRDRALGQPRNTTDEPQVVHQAPPYNLQSLRDLYSQLPSAPEHLRRFGSDVFVSRDAKAGGALSATATAPALDVPIGPDYVVGPGDMLNVSLWGGLSQTLPRTVDREGRVMLPEAGEVQVAGLTLGRAESVITSALQRQFRNAQVAVTVARLRTVRVYVVGDVQRPGAYDISSLSSPLSALYAAGGPTATGSLRVLKHLRSDKLIGEIDLYDFLLHGIRTDDDKLEGGDTLLVPPAGPQVAVYGAVKRPAIYELHNETSLAAVMEEAGGATVAASLGHITVERIDANQQRETIGLNMAGSGAAGAAQAAIASFEVKDGDRVRVVSIAPYSERVVYVRGHVVRPGREPYRDGMRLSDVLHSYQDLLPEPAERGEIVRLVPPDLHPEAIEFDVPDVLIGNSNLPLQPFDTIRVYGRYEHDAPNVQIRGEVIRPGSYALSEGMTAADLVRMAGGFKRDALLDDADLISYSVVNGTKAIQERRDLRIGDAVQKSDRDADAPLKAGDVLTIHQITGWSDIGASIRIEGEVGHPGSYGFRQGEHLSDVLLRAGGFRDTAYAEGAVLTRPEVRALEEKSRDELVRQIETSSAAARLSPAVSGTGDQGGTLQLIQQQQQQVLSRLKNQPATGRMVIHINADIKSWAGTTADIEVRAGDVLRVPKRPGFVLVSGQVYNAVAITFAPGKSAKWYLQRAGGATQVANRGQIFIIRANGSVVGRTPGWYGHDVLSTRLEPGDVIVVPQKIIGASLWWRNLLGTAQIASSIAIAAAVGAGL
jgi:protein involved in polysaccharide export with SLBB domain